MTVARYFGCTFVVGGTSPLSVREMAFLDSLGADLSTGGTASASSFNTGFVTPDKAFDKDLGTQWTNASSDIVPHLTYDHGSAVDVVQIRINLGSLGSFAASDSNIRWSVSDDGTTWSRPAPVRLVSGTIAANTEATYDLIQHADLTFHGLESAFLPFAGSALPSGMPTTFLMDATAPYRDTEFAGAGFIAGTVKRDADPSDVPLKRRVRLHREQDGMLIRETWSNATTGAYSFPWINETWRYTVITYDYEHNYRAVIADNILPELMP